MAHILVVEDNEDLAFGLRRSLEGEGHIVDVAPDGTTAIRLATERRPALVLLDIMLPAGMDGFRTLEALRRMGLDAPIIMLTARGAEVDKVHGLRLGADDYVTKPFGLSELMARVGAHLRRAGGWNEAGAAPYGFSDIEIQPAARVVTKGGVRVALTPREYALLLSLVRTPGVVRTRVSLLRDVWGHAADVLTRTVDIHVGELRRKLEDEPSSPRHFITVWKAGYRFDP
ncbi:MAG TPA: response regulator transcription factor [Gemmatimonas sp.]|nr:response regulator transcription factor [Gemmatimonas sp.]